MERQDWLAAGAVAIVVALAVVVAGAPPNGWAENASTPPAIPYLQPATLKIPVLDAKVTAASKRRPGEVVVVEIVCESSQSRAAESLPIVLRVMKNDPASYQGRMALSGPAETVFEYPVTLTLDAEGKAHETVSLPLTWAPAPPKPTPQPQAVPLQTTVKPAKTKNPDYFALTLSSPLVKTPVTVTSGKAAPADGSRQDAQILK